jgi:hypothetical protein
MSFEPSRSCMKLTVVMTPGYKCFHFIFMSPFLPVVFTRLDISRHSYYDKKDPSLK